MALANLADLQAALTDFSARTDIATSVLNHFITLAETDIQNGVYDTGGNALCRPMRVPSMETYDAAFALTGEYTDLPAGFLEAREVKLTSITGRPPLELIAPDAFDSTYSSDDSGPPVAYSIVGTQIRVGPGASATDTLGITYYSAIPPLVDNSTNWLMTKSPNAYLYGALRHLAPYAGEVERLAVWQAAFMSALAGIEASAPRRARGR
jgi:hypothetical protein